jgi:hypothetical protein
MTVHAPGAADGVLQAREGPAVSISRFSFPFTIPSPSQSYRFSLLVLSSVAFSCFDISEYGNMTMNYKEIPDLHNMSVWGSKSQLPRNHLEAADISCKHVLCTLERSIGILMYAQKPERESRIRFTKEAARSSIHGGLLQEVSKVHFEKLCVRARAAQSKHELHVRGRVKADFEASFWSYNKHRNDDTIQDLPDRSEQVVKRGLSLKGQACQQPNSKPWGNK